MYSTSVSVWPFSYQTKPTSKHSVWLTLNIIVSGSSKIQILLPSNVAENLQKVSNFVILWRNIEFY